MYVATMESAVTGLCQKQPHHHLHRPCHYYYYTKLSELLDFQCLCLLLASNTGYSERSRNVSRTKRYAFDERELLMIIINLLVQISPQTISHARQHK